jgi:hypothetical protein
MKVSEGIEVEVKRDFLGVPRQVVISKGVEHSATNSLNVGRSIDVIVSTVSSSNK